MKFALATDNSAEPSYYCKNGRYHRTFTSEDVTHTDLPYTAFFTFPEIFDGHFINLKSDTYPDEQFDLILAAIETDSKYLDFLRSLYPTAVIIGMYKEYWNNNSRVRNYVIENTDAYCFPYFHIDLIKMYNLYIPKRMVILPQPLNPIAIQNRFGNYNLKSKKDVIFNYSKTTSAGRGSVNNKEILIKVELEQIDYTGPRGFQSFTECWSPCRYMLSTDKTDWGGVMSAQAISLNTIMVGSNTDYQKILFPDLVGTSVDYLSSKIDKLHSNEKYRNDIINYAYDKLLNTYAFKSVKEKTINLYDELRK